MPLAQHAASISATRKQSLESKHTELEGKLRELMHHPSSSDFEIRKLKRLKLKVKEEIEAIH